MPNKNGIELINAIRKINQNVPILVVSAFSDEEIIKEPLEGKVTEYFSKPIDKKKFSDVIKILLENYKLVKFEKKELLNSKNTNMQLNNRELIVVGIGASAGGLEALSSLMHSLPLKKIILLIL